MNTVKSGCPSYLLSSLHSYENQEVDYICAHLGFLNMIDAVKTEFNQTIYERSEAEHYTPISQQRLCNIWVST